MTLPLNGSSSTAAVPAPRGRKLLGLDPLRFWLCVLIVMTMSRIHQHFAFLRPLRPALTVTLLVAMYAYLNPKLLSSGSMFRTAPAKVMAALGVMACLSVPTALSIGRAGSFILQDYSKVLILAFLLIAAIRGAKDLYAFAWAMVISAGALSYLSLFVFKVRKGNGDFAARIAGGYTWDANDICLILLVALPFVLLVLENAKPRARALCFVAIIGIGAAIARTVSRGGFLGLISVGLALLFLVRHVALPKRIAAVATVIFGLAAFAPSGYWDQIGTMLHPEDDYNMTSPTGRKAVAQRGLGYMMYNPFTGIGADNFPVAEATISPRMEGWVVGMTGIKQSAAHNSYLQAAAEMGIPGGALFIALVLSGIIIPFQLRSRMPKAWLKGDREQRFLYHMTTYLPVAFIGFAVPGAFLSFAYNDPIYLLSAFNAGLILAIDRKRREGTPGAAPGVVAAPARPAPYRPSVMRGLQAPVLPPRAR
ncbi:MAG TPA: O-antigen ligase family protein [Gemmatimonadales bacterium]|nr:O-antigen ligase family protein [Gemmatimonadales bacterium]